MLIPFPVSTLWVVDIFSCCFRESPSPASVTIGDSSLVWANTESDSSGSEASGEVKRLNLSLSSSLSLFFLQSGATYLLKAPRSRGGSLRGDGFSQVWRNLSQNWTTWFWGWAGGRYQGWSFWNSGRYSQRLFSYGAHPLVSQCSRPMNQFWKIENWILPEPSLITLDSQNFYYLLTTSVIFGGIN